MDGLRAGAADAALLPLALLAQHVELAAGPDGLEGVVAPRRRRRGAAGLHRDRSRAVLPLLLLLALPLLLVRRGGGGGSRHGLRLRHCRGTGGGEEQRGAGEARVLVEVFSSRCLPNFAVVDGLSANGPIRPVWIWRPKSV